MASHGDGRNASSTLRSDTRVAYRDCSRPKVNSVCSQAEAGPHQPASAQVADPYSTLPSLLLVPTALEGAVVSNLGHVCLCSIM